MNLRPGRGTDPAEEERLIREMTLDLETLATGTSLAPPIGFTDQVMAAIVDEPLPQPVRAFGLALAAGRLRAAGSAVGDAWRVATSGFAPIGVRAQAFALVLIVAVGSATVAGGAAVGAATLFAGPPGVPSPTTPVPSPSPIPSTSPDPSPSFEPSGSLSPTDTAGPTGSDDHGGGGGTASPATVRATGTDDHGGGSGSGSGSGSGGSGSGSGGSGSGHGGGSGSGSGKGGSGGGGTPEPDGTDDDGGGSGSGRSGGGSDG